VCGIKFFGHLSINTIELVVDVVEDGTYGAKISSSFSDISTVSLPSLFQPLLGAKPSDL